MSTNNHTAISNGAAGNSSIVNTPLGALDAAIGDISAFSETSLSAIIDTVIDTDGSMKAGAVDVTTAIADGIVTDGKLASDAKVGSLAALTTTIKTSAVGAINEIDAAVDTIAINAPTTLDDNNFSLAQAVVDTDNRIVEGVTTTGGKLIGNELQYQQPSGNNMGATRATRDDAGRMVEGVSADGGKYITGLHLAARGNNDRRLIDAWTDARGRVVRGVTADGRAVDYGDPLQVDVTHILSSGQSLSIGGGGSAGSFVTDEQPYKNLMFSTTANAAFAPLAGAMPGVNATGEAPNLAMANMITALVLRNHATDLEYRTLHSLHGVGSAAYSVIKKGGSGTAYANGMAQVVAGMKLAQQYGLSYRVGAVTIVHGEQNHIDATTAAVYEGYLREFQADYEADVKAMTGQPGIVPMLTCQMSSWTSFDTPTTSPIPIGQLAAAVNNAGRIYLVGPKYQLPYSDGTHLTAAGYQRLGEYYGKALYKIVAERKGWQPLRPIHVSRSAAVITAVFHVPVGVLEIDTTNVSNPGDYGFEYTDAGDGNSVTISSVAITGPNVVQVTLSGTPTGTAQKLRYAYTGTAAAGGGPTTGPRGNLRDQDTTASLHGHQLYNWCVIFDEAIN